MNHLSPSNLLDAWEQGQAELPVQRALSLLSMACPDIPRDEFTMLGMGSRDALLLRLREMTFGPRMKCMIACPGCGERLEMEIFCDEIMIQAEVPVGPFAVSANGLEVHFRLPDSRDILALPCFSDASSARASLARTCIIDVSGIDPPGKEEIPEYIVDAVAEMMGEIDPQGDIRLDLACPRCSMRFQKVFDIASFFWGEIDAWAKSALREVHILASAYGWSESEVLALSPRRRQTYLEMVQD